jgi:hypothetical protein
MYNMYNMSKLYVTETCSNIVAIQLTQKYRRTLKICSHVSCNCYFSRRYSGKEAGCFRYVTQVGGKIPHYRTTTDSI